MQVEFSRPTMPRLLNIHDAQYQTQFRQINALIWITSLEIETLETCIKFVTKKELKITEKNDFKNFRIFFSNLWRSLLYFRHLHYNIIGRADNVGRHLSRRVGSWPASCRVVSAVNRQDSKHHMSPPDIVKIPTGNSKFWRQLGKSTDWTSSRHCDMHPWAQAAHFYCSQLQCLDRLSLTPSVGQ